MDREPRPEVAAPFEINEGGITLSVSEALSIWGELEDYRQHREIQGRNPNILLDDLMNNIAGELERKPEDSSSITLELDLVFGLKDYYLFFAQNLPTDELNRTADIYRSYVEKLDRFIPRTASGG